MNEYYKKELVALQKSGRFRKREILNGDVADFASNDYLGLAHNGTLHIKACQRLQKESIHAPKASLLVGGYHPIHQSFEKKLCAYNGFEAGIIVGSGFAANIALIEALVRKNDILLIDASYHASGMLASRIKGIAKEEFSHNDMLHLERLLQKHKEKKRRIVAVEGIYSMEGDMVPREVFALCERFDAILIVDEAHSSGVVGKKLRGVFDYYGIEPMPNHIKMGTLGKAYGSFGAYILASSHIISYLENRAKPLIYATALGLYDTLLGKYALEYIDANAKTLKNKIAKRQKIVKEIMGKEMPGLICPIEIGDNKKVLAIKDALLLDGYFIGAIREPTVKRAIIRVIARLGEDEERFADMLKKVKKLIK